MRPTPDQLNEWFAYDPDTGIVTRKVRRHKWPAGSVIGTPGARGYIVSNLAGKPIPLHQIIWAMQTGVWSTEIIDHKNRDKHDNTWSNLRQVSPSMNVFNSGDHPMRGVERRGNSYRAVIKKNGKKYRCGSFPTAEEARAAYKAEANRLFGENPN